MNISSQQNSSVIDLFRLLGQPLRLQIILIIAKESACVCHMEAVLGVRQAAISQQLMLLRDAGLVVTFREGRHIYYRLAHPEMYDAVCQIAISSGLTDGEVRPYTVKPVMNCPCPKCNPDMDVELACKKLSNSQQGKNL